MYMLSQDCVTYMRTASSAPTTTTKKSTLTASPSTFIATQTESNGSVATVTAVINPTSSSASDTQSSDLSKGAVVGIAVGATLGGILIIAVIAYLIYRCVSSRKADRPTEAATAAIATHQDAPHGRSDDKAELYGQGKPVSPSTVSTTPVSALDASVREVSPNTITGSLMPSTMTTTPSSLPLDIQSAWYSPLASAGEDPTRSSRRYFRLCHLPRAVSSWCLFSHSLAKLWR